MNIRIFMVIGLSISLFFLPWWLSVLCVILYGVYYSPAYELLIYGCIADVLYGTPYIYTMYTACFCVGVYIVRSYIRT